ncbi:Legumain like [Fasciola hepatica]|uniref:Hemoglobinase n=1 Tax=Fasciola hepatica TaxID=6192 RepID=A0A4E0QX35_FASHE|nr:Legumain like [Fasciola hepatica]
MKFCLLILSLLIGFILGLDGYRGKHWVLLVAGSNGWSNYRHQADICHAYQLLRGNGIPPENIITMIYDDIANNTNNPFPGKVFNDYQHKDVYEGVKIDYRGEDVTPDTFLRVLKGDQKLKESGFKVVESGPADNVFVFFSGLGAPNLIAFPHGELHAKQLNKVLVSMDRERRYRKMVLYVEASNSGSMFRRTLSSDRIIWAMTSTNPTESSWATFCNDVMINTCLADEFSYQWMNDTEKYRGLLFYQHMLDQYLDVQLTMKNGHPRDYGDRVTYFFYIGDFQTSNTRVNVSEYNGESSMATQDESRASHAHLIPLMHQQKRSNSPKQMELAQRRLHRALKLGQIVKETVDEIVEEVTSKSSPSSKPSDVHMHLECYQNVYNQYKIKCFSIQQVPEVAKELVKFDRMCEQGYDTNVIVQAIFSTCG